MNEKLDFLDAAKKHLEVIAFITLKNDINISNAPSCLIIVIIITIRKGAGSDIIIFFDTF